MNLAHCTRCNLHVAVESFSTAHKACWECIHQQETNIERGNN